MATVGSVQHTEIPGGGSTGCGFVLHDDQATPCATLSYATEEDANRARALIQEALDNALSVVCSHDR
jgi:hypothetical protein